MSKRHRWSRLAGVMFAAGALLLGPPGHAQTQEQRDEYARQYLSGGATRDELAVLRDVQERRLSLPANTRGFGSFIAGLPSMKAMSAGATPELGMLMFWNEIALYATALDHTTEVVPAPPTYGEQLGPTRTSRALAIVHLSMFEAVDAIFRKANSYHDVRKKIFVDVGVQEAQVNPKSASVKAAIVAAGYQSLRELYPEKASLLQAAQLESLVLIGDPVASRELGTKIGLAAARLILTAREFDGSARPDLSSDDLKGNHPLDWRKDPISQLEPALGGNWGRVKPFVISSPDVHRPAPPPSLESAEFIAAYKEVKRLGGDPNAPTVAPRWPTATNRTGADLKPPLDSNNETFKGIFWGYDGTALLCAPPRLYNMIATSIALKEKPITKVEEMARFLALINLAMADAGISAWEAKYHYLYARPITAIRAIDADSSPEGRRELNWTPLGAPVTNGQEHNRNLTPPFPSYPSGHAVFGGAVFQAMRNYWGLSEAGVPFDFVSDEYNGLNRGPGDAEPRAEVRVNFAGFDKAEEENAMSRVWLGIHWRFDATAGIAQGRLVANDVAAGALALK